MWKGHQRKVKRQRNVNTGGKSLPGKAAASAKARWWNSEVASKTGAKWVEGKVLRDKFRDLKEY